MKVCVCVITYQRPEGLKRLLKGLNRLAFDKCEVPDLDVIVVDNDPAGFACTLVKETSSGLNWPVKCFVEPSRGIPYARNESVARTLEANIDFIAFIDDDEVPEPFWLDELLYIQQLYNADVVAGLVLPHFTVPVAPWVEKGEFFQHGSRSSTGELLDWAATSNMLVSSDVFRTMRKFFDTRFALSGGSDYEFFRRVSLAGHKIVWAADAVVYEWVPKSRANVRWLLQRAYRIGNTYGLVEPELEHSIATRARVAVEASKLMVSGLLLLRRSVGVGLQPTVEIQIRYRVLIQQLQKISRGAGMISGIAGKRYEEYRKILH